MREYIITVKDPNVWNTSLWNELTVNGLGDNYIPKRAVEVTNERPFNDYAAHFNLTDEEADLIRQDSRILNVELNPDLDDSLIKDHFGTRSLYTYDKSNTTVNNMKNWGLIRANSLSNPFSASTTLNSEFTYNLDGTGVDIIVMDTGVDPDHPEFAVNADGTGGSRVVNFDWFSLGVPGVPTGESINGYLGDYDGHGSNCASIAAGNTCGWARGAQIYSIRINLGSGPFNDIRTGVTLGTISSTYAYDLVRAFHLKKLTDGNTRPTICTNSWGYSRTFSTSTMQAIFYRGTRYTVTSPQPQYGQIGSSNPVCILSVDQSVNNASNAGVIMVGASGNSSYKIDVPGGLDYDNYYDTTVSTYNYYHRGSSPVSASSMISVGAIDNSTVEQKVYFSNCGPRIDIYSPGTMIMGAYANKTYRTPAVADTRNNLHYLNKISGTSQATPQVTGLLACVLQARPKMTTTEAKEFLIESSIKNVLQVSGVESYTNTTSLQGSSNRTLYMPFNSSIRGSINS